MKKTIFCIFVIGSIFLNAPGIPNKSHTFNFKSTKQTTHKPITTKVKPITKVKISNVGVKLIKDNEKYSGQCYKDGNSVTFGWGHKINKDDPKWLQKKKPGDWIQKSVANQYFEQDINKFTKSVQKICDEFTKHGVHKNIAYNQHIIDGMFDLIYNCGASGVYSSEFYRLMKAKKVDEAIASIKTTYIYYPGHKERRLKCYTEMMKYKA